MASWLEVALALPVLGQTLRLLVLAVLFLFVRRALRLSARQLEHRIDRHVVELDRRTRLRTLLRACYNVAVVTIMVVMLTMGLQTVGVYIVPVLASAGVVGLAISLGAQSVIRDFISGILILAEDHFRVGDLIEVNTLNGEVVRMTLRVTYLSSPEGKLHSIPNGDIRTITNVTRQWGRAVVDLELAGDGGQEAGSEDVARRALRAAAAAVQAMPGLQGALLGAPEIVRWERRSGGGVSVRIVATAAPASEPAVSQALQREVIAALAAAGVTARGAAPDQ